MIRGTQRLKQDTNSKSVKHKKQNADELTTERQQDANQGQVELIGPIKRLEETKTGRVKQSKPIILNIYLLVYLFTPTTKARCWCWWVFVQCERGRGVMGGGFVDDRYVPQSGL